MITIARAALLYAGLALVCMVAALDWSTAEIRRLYLDDPEHLVRQEGELEQRFTIRGHRVHPEIVGRGATRFEVRLQTLGARKLVFSAEPVSDARYEIHAHSGNERRLLTSATLDAAVRESIALPGGSEQLEFNAQGSLKWVDLNVVRPVALWPLYAVAAVTLTVCAVRLPRRRLGAGANWLVLATSVALCLAAAELALSLRANRLPSPVAAARAEFGLAAEDPRWIDPHRYRVRLRPNLDTFLQWRHGDIVRLGFVPAAVAPGTVHRFALRTDAEGFRNDKVREKVEIAALGDSFTDATTGPVEQSWPSRLAQHTGRAVQNYGTSGFGPQQELYVLRDYVLQRAPDTVVLAFSAGNDLHDAEAFAHWERERTAEEERSGWKLRAAFRRYESLHLWTLLQVATDSLKRRLGRAEGEPARQRARALGVKPGFDQGMFTLPVNGETLQFSFLPPYLQKLRMPRQELERSRGWELAQAALREMRAECAGRQISFVVMFVPEKTQVYWTTAEQFLSPAKLQEAVDFYGRHDRSMLQLDEVRTNRLAQNELLRDFCAAEGILMLDLTAALEAELRLGREVYFPDDTHWNAHGHDVAARELAQFLARRP